MAAGFSAGDCTITAQLSGLAKHVIKALSGLQTISRPFQDSFSSDVLRALLRMHMAPSIRAIKAKAQLAVDPDATWFVDNVIT